jgi:predicted small lipoprotein YifL
MANSPQRWLAAVMLTFGLQACGLKGDLYLEEPTETAPPSVELKQPEVEADDPITEEFDVEEVGIGTGVPEAEAGLSEADTALETSDTESDSP